jgi:DNA repair protein RecO (recombination protein O)
MKPRLHPIPTTRNTCSSVSGCSTACAPVTDPAVPPVQTESIILHAFAYGETSRILRLLTHEYGVQSVIAKGALRPRSRFGGVLEPFTEGRAAFFMKDGRELHTLTSFELDRSAQVLGRDLLRYGGASLIAELVMRTASEQSDPELFHAVREGLRRIANAPATGLESVLLAETWALVDRLGFGPALEHCIACGRALATDSETTFDYTAGGVRCPACANAAPGRPLPAAARAALASLVHGNAVALTRTAAHWRLLARYIEHHVVEGAPLRSLTFLTEALGEAGGGRP